MALIGTSVLAGFLAVTPLLAGRSAIVTDYSTGAVLWAEDAEAKRYPASLTKLMTLYLLFESVENGRVTLDQKLPVTKNAAQQPPTRLRLRPGSTIRVAECIDALILRSANDVAVVVAEALGGSESAFAASMTRKAAELGMTDTVFRNASGLPDDGQITTARDLSILARALMKRFPEFYSHFSVRASRAAGKGIVTHNSFLAAYDGADGLKTGYTQAAGHNLAASATRGGHRLVGIVLGEPSCSSRDRKMAQVMNESFLSLGVPPNRPASKRAGKPGRRRRPRGHAAHAARSARQPVRPGAID
ncbi:MAG: D-alanyl-D-alanine carboxypeptidase [Acidobacteria bacterium]|nr:D-alanyl-D-alanine carboxypeptidase [Acidobacteriota bacterium]